MTSIELEFSRSDKQVDLSWTVNVQEGGSGLSATAPIILLADTADKTTKQIALDAGTTSYTVETDSYFVANPTTIYSFVIVGTDASDATNLVSSNEISLSFIEIPKPNFSLVPLNKAFQIDLGDDVKDMANFHGSLQGENTYDSARSITQVVVNVTTTNPLAMWQAVYNVADMAGNSIIVGKDTDNDGDGLVPAATSNRSVFVTGLKNFQTYEVNVSYVSDEAAPGNGNANTTGSLGRGEEGSVEAKYVIPSLRFSAPRNLTIVETPGEDAQVDIYWNAPANDFGKEGTSGVTTVTKYQVYVTSSDPGTAAPEFTDDIPSAWSLVKELTLTATDTIYKAYSELAYTQAVSTKRWYVVRAVRILETDPADAELDRDDDNDDTTSHGHFCAPVPFTTFVHTALNAPTLADFVTAVDNDAITFKVSSPDNATTLALDADGYTAQKLTVGVSADIDNIGIPQDLSVTLQQNEQTYTNTGINLTQLDGGHTISFGLSYTFNSALYTQPGKLINLGPDDGINLQTIGTTATEYTSANANGSSQIAGGASVTRTPFQTPAAPASPSSTGLNVNAPLSEANNGKLSFSWTNLASYDNSSGTDSKFFSAIKYRVFGAVTTPTTLDDNDDNASHDQSANAVENLTGSPLIVEGLTFGIAYHLKVQAYFYNDEMNIWVKGAKTTAVSTGNVPFYYPADVTNLAYVDDVTLNEQTLTWSNPDSNGVKESDEVAFYFKIQTNVNDEIYSEPVWQAAASYGTVGESNTYSVNTDLGSVYSAKVTSGYALQSLLTDIYEFTRQNNSPTAISGWLNITKNGQTNGYSPSSPGIDVPFTVTDLYALDGNGNKVYTVASYGGDDLVNLQDGLVFSIQGSGDSSTWHVIDVNGSRIAEGVTVKVYKDYFEYSNEQENGTADIAYLARPHPPSISVVPSDESLSATFSNDSRNNAAMTFVEFEQAIGNDALTGITGSTNEYTGLNNGVTYTIRALSVYKYPSNGDEFRSTITEQEVDTIAFGKPIVDSVTFVVDETSATEVTISMSNNGGPLRELLAVGIPLDTNIDGALVTKQFLGVATVTVPATQVAEGGEDDVTRALTVNFDLPLKEVFVVLENEAGSTVTLSTAT